MVLGGAAEVGRRGFGARQLVALTAALFAARLLVSLTRTGPVLVADEIGYLMNARVLAGDLPGQLQLAPFYHGGYSLLLAPLISLTSDPRFAYALVLTFNAALAASVFPLLYVLLTRCAGVPPRLAAGAALAGSVYPSITVLSQVAMSENALYPLTCVWLIAFVTLLSAREPARRVLWAGGLGASAAALWAVHGRMITAVILTGAVVAWLGLHRRISPADVAATLGVLGAGMLATHFLDSFLIARNYGGHAPNEAELRISALSSPHALLLVGENLVGQAWYLIVATFALAAVVCATVVGRSRRLREPGVDAAVKLLTGLTVLLLLVSAASFVDRTRPDMLIYGRYVGVAAPALVAFGVVVLSRRRTPPRLGTGLIGLAGLTAAVVLFRLSMTGLHGANRWNVASLPFVTAQLGPPILIGAAVVAAFGSWLLSRTASWRAGGVWLVTLALFVPTIAYGLWNPVLQAQRSSYPAGWRSPAPVASRLHIKSVGYDTDHYVGGLYAIQWFLPRTSLRLFSAGAQHPPEYVLNNRSWARLHPSADAVVLWSSHASDLVLWRLVGQ